MIRPSAFRMNEETAVNNAYQSEAPGLSNARECAEDEFDGVVKALRQHGVKVAVYDSDPEDDTPDALFPNNWVSFHRDGRVGLYPMFAENRRRERREPVLHSLCIDHDLELESIVDFTEFEQHRRLPGGDWQPDSGPGEPKSIRCHWPENRPPSSCTFL